MLFTEVKLSTAIGRLQVEKKQNQIRKSRKNVILPFLTVRENYIPSYALQCRLQILIIRYPSRVGCPAMDRIAIAKINLKLKLQDSRAVVYCRAWLVLKYSLLYMVGGDKYIIQLVERRIHESTDGLAALGICKWSWARDKTRQDETWQCFVPTGMYFW